MMRFLCLTLLMMQTLLAAELKVLTLNTYALPDIGEKKATLQRMQAICERLNSSDYDVVFLQELWMTKYRKAFKNCGFPEIIDHGEKSFSSGLMILSRHPISNSRRYILPKVRNIASVFKGEGIAKKSLYAAQIEVSGTKIWVATTHLVANYCENEDWIKCEPYTNMRRQQMEYVSSILTTKLGSDPVIFGGDLNMGAKKIAHDSVWDEMSALLPGYSEGSFDSSASTYSGANLFNAGKADPGKIDHLWGSAFFTLSNSQLAMTETFVDRKGIERQYSDHYGWESTFNF